MLLIEYSSNNSGGSWWLSDKDWKNLEEAGWKVQWANLDPKYEDDEYNDNYVLDDNGYPILAEDPGKHFKAKLDEDGIPRWMGAMARNAWKLVDSPREAIEDFENITGQDASDEGCTCCGPPHSFNWDDEEGNYQYCSGSSCLEYLYEDAPTNLRQACEMLKER